MDKTKEEIMYDCGAHLGGHRKIQLAMQTYADQEVKKIFDWSTSKLAAKDQEIEGLKAEIKDLEDKIEDGMYYSQTA